MAGCYPRELHLRSPSIFLMILIDLAESVEVALPGYIDIFRRLSAIRVCVAEASNKDMSGRLVPV